MLPYQGVGRRTSSEGQFDPTIFCIRTGFGLNLGGDCQGLGFGEGDWRTNQRCTAIRNGNRHLIRARK